MNQDTEIALIRKHNDELIESNRFLALQLSYLQQQGEGQELALPVLQGMVETYLSLFPDVPYITRLNMARTIADGLDNVTHITPRVEARRA